MASHRVTDRRRKITEMNEDSERSAAVIDQRKESPAKYTKAL